MLIAIVRHGQTDYNLKKLVQGHVDNPLNKTGINQAIEVGNKLKNSKYKFNKIASSTLSRAINTADEINKILNVDDSIFIDPIFIERDFSLFDGKDVEKSLKEIKEKEPTKNFETNKELLLRGKNALELLKRKYKKDNVILTTHSHFIKSLLINIDANKYSFDYPLQNGHTFILKLVNNKFKIIDELI